MILSTCSPAGIITAAIGNALGIVFGADEIGYRLAVFGCIRGDAV